MECIKVIFDGIIAIMNIEMDVLGYDITFMKLTIFLSVLGLLV